jgi:hypothetical protein
MFTKKQLKGICSQTKAAELTEVTELTEIMEIMEIVEIMEMPIYGFLC